MRKRKEAKVDERVVYGVLCTWWDDIKKAGKTPIGLPCCPFCQSPLCEVPNMGIWMKGVHAYTENEWGGYKDFMLWLRGRCLPTYEAARLAYEFEKRNEEGL